MDQNEEIRRQREYIEYYEKKRKQEEEDIRMAKMLMEEIGEEKSNVDDEKRRKQEEEDIRLARELMNEAEQKLKRPEVGDDEEFARRLQEELNSPPPTTTTTSSKFDPSPEDMMDSSPRLAKNNKRPLTDSDYAKQLQEEANVPMMGTLDLDIKEDAELAKKLQQEEEERNRESRNSQSDFDREIANFKAAAQLEADEKLERARMEKERLEQQLQELEYKKFQKENDVEFKTFKGVAFPSHWEKQTTDYQVFNVKKDSPEWKSIKRRFDETAPGTGIKKIERHQNRTQWTFYFLKREQIAGKHKGNPQELQLYHGSRQAAYHIILTEGFDHRVANMGGAIGAGTYFATHASYSKNYTTESRMLYCRVTVGKHGTGVPGIRMPPKGYDSVAAVSHGNGMYVVFDNHQCYPEYMIYY